MLIDLKRTKKKTKEETGPQPVGSPEYPWGLQLTFENETLEKLGIAPKDFSVGENVLMICAGKITRLSQVQNLDLKERSTNSVEIQIQKIDFNGKKHPSKMARVAALKAKGPG